MSDRTVCIVQARTGSTRLPGKVLADLAGRPLLRFLLDRVDRLPVDEVVVATSRLPRDDAVAELAEDAGRPVVRGAEADVLDRFAGVLDRFPAETVVRITADCPLTDPAIVAAVMERHRERDADYTSNVLPRTFPRGLDVEVARGEAVMTAWREASDPAEREHVMPFLYRRPERFLLANLRNAEALGGEGWTVDTAEDLAFVRSLVARMGGDGDFGWREAWKEVGPRGGAAAGVLRLRPAEPDDRRFVLACRNEPEAVRRSGTGRAVGRAEHDAWFAARLDDPGTRLWIGVIDTERLGTVRVDVEGGVGTVSIAVSPGARGRGHGRALLSALLAELEGDQQVTSLVASVQAGNEASRRLFVGAGFEEAGPADGPEAPATPGRQAVIRLRRPSHRPIDQV